MGSMSDPVLSMIIPCYNHGKYLKDAICSIFGGATSLGMMPGQTIKDQMEVIVVDDASTDDTPLEIQKLLPTFNNLRYYRMPANKGTPSANNVGLRLAKGQFLTVMSADDMREPESLERMLGVAMDNTHSFVYDDTVIFTGGQRQKFESGAVRIWRMEEYDFEQLIQHNQMHTGIVFHKQAFLDTGGYPEIMRHGREDWAFHVALGVKGYCGIHLLQGGYLYRREGQNRTLTNQSSEWQKKFTEQMHSLFPDIYRGRRPMGCCGNRGANRQQLASGGTLMSTLNDPLPGSKGMTLVQFYGTSNGKRSFFGKVTGTRYSVSAGKNRAYVDNLDLPGILEINEDGGPLFRVAAPSTPVQPKPAVVEVAPAPAIKSQPLVKAATSEPLSDGAMSSIQMIPGLGVSATEKLIAAGVKTLKDFIGKTPEELAEITGWKHPRAEFLQEAAKGLLNEPSA